MSVRQPKTTRWARLGDEQKLDLLSTAISKMFESEAQKRKRIPEWPGPSACRPIAAAVLASFSGVSSDSTRFLWSPSEGEQDVSDQERQILKDARALLRKIESYIENANKLAYDTDDMGNNLGNGVESFRNLTPAALQAHAALSELLAEARGPRSDIEAARASARPAYIGIAERQIGSAIEQAMKETGDGRGASATGKGVAAAVLAQIMDLYFRHDVKPTTRARNKRRQ